MHDLARPKFRCSREVASRAGKALCKPSPRSEAPPTCKKSRRTSRSQKRRREPRIRSIDLSPVHRGTATVSPVYQPLLMRATRRLLQRSEPPAAEQEKAGGECPEHADASPDQREIGLVAIEQLVVGDQRPGVRRDQSHL